MAASSLQTQNSQVILVCSLLLSLKRVSFLLFVRKRVRGVFVNSATQRGTRVRARLPSAGAGRRERSDVKITKNVAIVYQTVTYFSPGQSIVSPPTTRAQPGPPPSLRSHTCPTTLSVLDGTPLLAGSVRLFPPSVPLYHANNLSCCNVSTGCETSEEELGE